ncbi:OmcA/MtrC family decaheme c-type cytochrome [Paraferrimonas sedimenticola]|uniref:Cytochrome c n=1 Tax=Paraferrimonas sedimenticola TaxID=375674 RepID=A0AA37W1K9_9GAMM|nr:OmcA/MtrC family decaheme c-type cytochrome [Paraferrimonas sedimenticola]GLP96357.1 cytochrome c [Paraferrimonas sedimenticola]
MNKKLLLAAMFASIGLAGCGDDGKDGPQGPAGPEGPQGPEGPAAPSGVLIDVADTAFVSIDNANYNSGVITVDFSIVNESGKGLYGLDGTNEFHDFRFSVAQLEVDADSPLKQWKSLLNETTNEAGTTFEQGFEKLSDCPECLTDNMDGTYSYSFKTNLAEFEDPAGVEFNPDITQRIAIEMQFEYDDGHELAENAHFDWIPASNTQEGIDTRQLVTLETCYTCHQPDSLRAHGGRRLDMENCQACHNGIVSDPNGVSVELGHMIHAIHKGKDRKGLDDSGNEAPMPYTVVGYHGPHAFDYPAFPTKPMMDCASCHVDDENLADKDLWKANANANSCSGCHTERPTGHGAFNPPADSVCTDCHSQVDHSKYAAPYQAAKDYSVKVTNVMVNDTNLIEFDVQVMDAEGNTVTADEIYQEGYSNPYMVVSWDVEKDYPESVVTAEGADFSLGTTYNHRRFSLKGDGSTTYDADTGVFHTTTEKQSYGMTYTLDVPLDIKERSLEILPILKVCFIKGTAERVACDNEKAYPAYVQTDAYRAILNDAEAEVADRRTIVDESTCYGCHSYEFYHDSNGVNCIACHTNDKVLKGNGTTSDGIALQKSTNFMYKGHKAAGHDNGHGGSGTILKSDCSTCHGATGHELGRNQGAAHTLPSTQRPTADDPVETWYASPDLAACMSCHQKYMSASAMAHVRQNGAYFGDDKSQAQAAVESCSVCHTPASLLESHGH